MGWNLFKVDDIFFLFISLQIVSRVTFFLLYINDSTPLYEWFNAIYNCSFKSCFEAPVKLVDHYWWRRSNKLGFIRVFLKLIIMNVIMNSIEKWQKRGDSLSRYLVRTGVWFGVEHNWSLSFSSRTQAHAHLDSFAHLAPLFIL